LKEVVVSSSSQKLAWNTATAVLIFSSLCSFLWVSVWLWILYHPLAGWGLGFVTVWMWWYIFYCGMSVINGEESTEIAGIRIRYATLAGLVSLFCPIVGILEATVLEASLVFGNEHVFWISYIQFLYSFGYLMFARRMPHEEIVSEEDELS